MVDTNNKSTLDQQATGAVIVPQMPVESVPEEKQATEVENLSDRLAGVSPSTTTSVPSPEIVDTIRELTKPNRRIAAKRTAQTRISRPQHVAKKATAPRKAADASERSLKKKRGRPAKSTPQVDRLVSQAKRTANDLSINVPMPQEERRQITIPSSVTTPVILILLLGIIFVAHRSIQGLRNSTSNANLKPAAVTEMANEEEAIAVPTEAAAANEPASEQAPTEVKAEEVATNAPTKQAPAEVKVEEAQAAPATEKTAGTQATTADAEKVATAANANTEVKQAEPTEAVATEKPETIPTANTTPVTPAPMPKPNDVPILAVKTIPPSNVAAASTTPAPAAKAEEKVEAKPVKNVEAPVAEKPADVKPVETATAETAAAEKPVEAKPVETTTAEAKPVDVKTTETKTAEAPTDANNSEKTVAAATPSTIPATSAPVVAPVAVPAPTTSPATAPTQEVATTPAPEAPAATVATATPVTAPTEEVKTAAATAIPATEKAAEPSKNEWTTKPLKEEDLLKMANLTKVAVPSGFIKLEIPAKYIYVPQQNTGTPEAIAKLDTATAAPAKQNIGPGADAPRKTWRNWTDPYTNSGPLDLDGEASRQQYLSSMNVKSSAAKSAKKTTEPVTAKAAASSSTASAPSTTTYPSDLAFENTPSPASYHRNASDYNNPWNGGGALDLDGPQARSIYQKQLTSRK